MCFAGRDWDIWNPSYFSNGMPHYVRRQWKCPIDFLLFEGRKGSRNGYHMWQLYLLARYNTNKNIFWFFRTVFWPHAHINSVNCQLKNTGNPSQRPNLLLLFMHHPCTILWTVVKRKILKFFLAFRSMWFWYKTNLLVDLYINTRAILY